MTLTYLSGDMDNVHTEIGNEYTFGTHRDLETNPDTHAHALPWGLGPTALVLCLYRYGCVLPEPGSSSIILQVYITMW